MANGWHERRVVRRATDLIAINPYIAQEYGPLTRARFHDIAISIGDGYFAAPPEVEGTRSLCVARGVPRKDIMTLLQAFAQILTAVPVAKLEIVGQADAGTEGVDEAVQVVAHHVEALAEDRVVVVGDPPLALAGEQRLAAPSAEVGEEEREVLVLASV